MTAVIDGAARTPWLPFGRAEAALRLYCLPHAGGSASAYRTWVGALGPVAVCPVQPPGREVRLREAALMRMHHLVDEIADVILAGETGEGGYAVYGHSLGALVAFELLHEIRRRGGPAPVTLFVSGSNAPDRPVDDGDPGDVPMSPADAVALLRRIGGTPEWLLADPSALEMILPPFIGDFAIKQTYRHVENPPVSTPIVAIAATADVRAGTGDVAAWRRFTSGGFELHTLHGGHFAVLEQSRRTLEIVGAALAPHLPAVA